MNEAYIIVHKPEINVDIQIKKGKKKSITTNDISKYSKSDFIQHVFKTFSNDIEDAKSKIQQDLLDSIFNNTFEYFDVYYQKRNKITKLNALTGLVRPLSSIFNIIPTIALFTGINIQDYSNLCEKYCLNLKSKLTDYLFVVNENNGQNMKILTYSLFSQLESIKNNGEKIKKKNLYTFRSFFDLVVTDKSNQKTNSVIFVFKQFELISKEIVENFISVISCYVERISIFFVIELAAQSNILYEHLSGNAISKLCIKKLYSMPANDYMNKFMTNIFVENLTPFKLSGDILKYLIDVYKNYNFSISHFIHALKYCLYEHLKADIMTPVFLCCTESTKTNSMFQDAYKKEIPEVDSLIRTCTLPKHESSKDILKSIKEIQCQWKKHHNRYSVLIKILFEVINSFPSENNGSDNLKSFSNASFVDLYVQISNLVQLSTEEGKKFIDYEQFKNLKTLLQFSSSSTFSELMSKISNILKEINPLDHTIEFMNELEKLYGLIEKHHDNEEKIFLQNSQSDYENIENEMNDSQKKLIKRSHSISRKSARPLLDNSNVSSDFNLSKENLARRKTQTNISMHFNSIPKQFIGWIVHQFTGAFDKNYTNAFSYSKYFCYSDISKLKQHLFVNQRISIHDGLVDPFKYLSKQDKQELVPISVIYKIYLECGHMINLFDWLQAFVEKMENRDLEELDEKKRKLMQALFFRAITELQFIGYIKQTSRKVDHVIKLTNIAYNNSGDAY